MRFGTKGTDLVAFGITNFLVTVMDTNQPIMQNWQTEQYLVPLKMLGLEVEYAILSAGDDLWPMTYGLWPITYGESESDRQ